MNEMWPTPSIAQKPRFVYTSRWDRLLARVWPTKRRELALMRRLTDMSTIEAQYEMNRLLTDMLLYGQAFARPDRARHKST